tara:strand:+ start:58 stop:2310 length:2253 start_codon:yes stop_codon:yes gene_type:complete
LIVLIVLSFSVLFVWKVEQATDQLRLALDSLLATYGLGFLIPGLCVAIGVFCATKKREFLDRKYWKIWLTIIVFSFISWGFTAIIPNPYPVTYVNSLGGNVGLYISGSSNLEAAMRFLLAMVVLAVILSPTRTLAALVGIIRVSVSVFSVALSTLSKYIKLRYRRKTSNDTHQFIAKQNKTISVAEAPVPLVAGTSITNRIINARKRAPNVPEGSGLQTNQSQPVIGETAQSTKSVKESADSKVITKISVKDISKWNLPEIAMLTLPPPGSQNPDIDQDRTSLLIENTLGDYGIEVTVDEVKPGPAVTMFGLVPGWNRRSKNVRQRNAEGKAALDEKGKPIITKVEDKTRVRVDSIVAREKDLALALAAPSLRIEAPIPGASLVGIEVPNPKPAVVTLRTVMETQTFARASNQSKLTLGLGLGTGGEVAAADLAKMPHLLIAGSTGSGKSVCINSVIASIIMQNSPWEVRLLLIDPKRVELTPYNGIPHLMEPVVVDVEKAVLMLKGMIQEMLRRYKIFEEAGVRNIEGYNERLSLDQKMPLLVVAVDELADLMMSASSDIERSITRLAQLGRATGIHLVVATQRPSVDVVTGLIKANFPSRISFAVASQVDSRTILDSVGAEKLLGRGDMLFQPPDAPKPKRIQGAFISDSEIEKLVDHWKNLQGPLPPKISLEFKEVFSAGELGSDDRDDELFDKALEVASQYNRLSTSLLQRRLKIGYPRAARLMDVLEEQGVVGPGEPGKSRDVIG